jgi:cytochrome c-type biogenesis protein CcmH
VILFWLICGGMLAFALFYVLPPVLHSEASKSKQADARREANVAIYRDQLSELEADLRNGIVSEEQYAQDRDDIERNLLADTTTQPEKVVSTKPKVRNRAALFALVNPFVALTYYLRNKNTTPAPVNPRTTVFSLAVVLPLAAISLYLVLGNPDGVTNPANASLATGAATSAPPAGERMQAQIEANVAALAKRLQSNPNDAQGWTMLARSYGSMEKYPEAAGAYAKATELTPGDADLWADYAYASAMASGRRLQGKPMEFVERALKLDPDNAKALGLAANAAFEAKDYQKAIDYWQRLLKRVPPGSDVAAAIDSRINEASHQKAQAAQGGKATQTP